MTLLHWLFLTFYYTMVLLLTLRVLLDPRQPAKTMAWILVLWTVPVLGIVLYFFFGQNTRRERIVSQKSMDQLTKRSMLSFVEQRNLRLPEEHRPLFQLFKNQDMALPFKDNEVEVFTSGYDFFPALLRQLASAQHHIHLEWFILADDALGRLVADVLLDRVRAGVTVRLIYDDVGCWNVPSRFFEHLRQGGVDVHAFLPVRFPMVTSKVNYRNHRKICVIDGSVGFIGGMNIALRYVKGKGRPWRDTHLMIKGRAVYGLQRAFLVDWYFVARSLIEGHEYYPDVAPSLCNDCLAQVVTSSPVTLWPNIMQGYVHAIHQARKYIYMESPYFLPTEPVLFALRTAALAGLDVRIMLPQQGDSRLVEWASTSYIQQVQKAGVQVFHYTKGFNHSKFMVVDDSICSVGSTNIDFRSFENDFEANVFFFDRKMALRIKQVFMDDLKHCIPLSPHNKRLHLPMRIWTSLLRLISPLM